MTRGGTDRRKTCLRAARAIRRSQLGQRLASSIRGTAMGLPFGSTVESWLPRPSACPRPSSRAVPRVDGASRHYLQKLWGRNSQTQLTASVLREQLYTQLSLGIAGKKLFEHLAECCSGVQLGEDR
jgi:hypothetical protein